MSPTAGISTISQTTVVSSFSSTSTFSSSFSSSTSFSFSSASDVRAAFRKFDVNGDGHIDMGELKQMMNAGGKKASDAEVQALFKKIDLDGDGEIDLNEFVLGMYPASAASLRKLQQSYKGFDALKAAFRQMDLDGDGYITRQELKSVMKGMSDTEVDAVFTLGDADQSGGIDYQEFFAMMVPNAAIILKKVSAPFSNIKQVREGFKRIDANGDGAISRAEMKSLRLSDQELDVVFALGDIDQDGEISMPEFVRLMSPKAAAALNRFRNSFRNIQEVASAFKRFDTNSDGAISPQELAAGMKSSGLMVDHDEVSAIFGLAEINQDGEVNYAEFVSALFPVAADGIGKFRAALKNITSVKEAFKRFDADGDGEISFQELKKGAAVLGQKFSDGELSCVFAIGDSDQDGKISFAEFA